MFPLNFSVDFVRVKLSDEGIRKDAEENGDPFDGLFDSIVIFVAAAVERHLFDIP